MGEMDVRMSFRSYYIVIFHKVIFFSEFLRIM